VNNAPAGPDLSTWTVNRLEQYVATLADSPELDRARQAARSHACQLGESEAGVRRRWAKLALVAPGSGHGTRTSLSSGVAAVVSPHPKSHLPSTRCRGNTSTCSSA
jgi:hypothetical protein